MTEDLGYGVFRDCIGPDHLMIYRFETSAQSAHTFEIWTQSLVQTICHHPGDHSLRIVNDLRGVAFDPSFVTSVMSVARDLKFRKNMHNLDKAAVVVTDNTTGQTIRRIVEMTRNIVQHPNTRIFTNYDATIAWIRADS